MKCHWAPWPVNTKPRLGVAEGPSGSTELLDKASHNSIGVDVEIASLGSDIDRR